MNFIPKSTFSAVRLKDGHLRGLDPRMGDLSSLILKSSKRFNDLFRRNAGRGLINVLLKIVKLIYPRLSSNIVIQVVMFTRKCYYLYRHNGMKGLTLYLKACQVLLQQSVGKYHVKDISELNCRPKRNRYGSPVFIHRSARSSIHKDMSQGAIMLGMTLFGVYRVLEFKGTLKLKTITDPFVVPDSILEEWTNFVNNDFQKYLLMKTFRKVDPKPEGIQFRPISTSSPTSNVHRIIDGKESVISTHYGSLGLSSYLGIQYREGIKVLKDFTTSLGSRYFMERLRMIAFTEPFFKSTADPFKFGAITTLDTSPDDDRRIYSADKGRTGHPLVGIPNKKHLIQTAQGILAKLSLKFEAAGKVRVFAMVDPGTQGSMEPLHKALFKLLRCLETDGTFDQVKPINTLIKKGLKKTTFYSLDLSAATDRLPISLQEPIVALVYNLIGVNKFRYGGITDAALIFARNWKFLLVDRFYYLYLSKRDFQRISGMKERTYKLKYSVGQPMGALSSGAMLAMTHHAIVIFCAKRAKVKDYKNFSDYAVLGDDIIIANSKVASAYLRFLSQIGVKVGLAKSIISKREMVLEFAKKFFVKGKQMNMIPIKDCLAVGTSNSLALEFVSKGNLKLPQILTFLDYGYKSKAKALQSNIFDIPLRQRINIIGFASPGSPHVSNTGLDGIGIINAYDVIDDGSEKELHGIIEILIEQVMIRHDSYGDAYHKWKKSHVDFVEKGTKYIPVSQDYIVSGAAMNVGHNESVSIPLTKVLLTPLTESIDTSFSPDDTVISSSSVPPKYSTKEPVGFESFMKDIPLGVDEIVDRFEENVYNWEGERFSDYEGYISLINLMCSGLLSGNDLDSKIKSELGPLTRPKLKLFDDFNSRYKFGLLANTAVKRKEQRGIKSIAGRHDDLVTTKDKDVDQLPQQSKPSQRPAVTTVKPVVTERWGLKILYLLMSYGIFFFALFILISSSLRLSYPNSPPEMAVRYVMVESANKGSEGFSWLLIFIIILLIGGLFYIYMLPPKIVVDKTRESILDKQVENLTNSNTNLSNEIHDHLNKISDLVSRNDKLVTDIQEKALEITKLKVINNDNLSVIESLRDKVAAYFESITKLRLEISEGVQNPAVMKVEKLLSDSQKELEILNEKFINLCTTVREHGHVPHSVELDQIGTNFNCEALTCLESIGRTMNPSHWYETLVAYKGDIYPMTISDVDDQLLRTVEILHRFFVAHADLADFASDIVL